jgi:DNA invertase Pin-like site-specific DNA recombinase
VLTAVSVPLIISVRPCTDTMTVSRTPRVALYGRVSTADQRADLQLDALRALAAQRQWTVHEEYCDAGYSGTKDRRPALDRLMADARRGKFGVVAVWRFDRFGRSLRHLVTALDEFRDLGIQFVSTQDAIDTATPSGRMMYGVIAAMSQFEAELIRERTVAGLAAARRRGVRLGRRPLLCAKTSRSFAFASATSRQSWRIRWGHGELDGGASSPESHRHFKDVASANAKFQKVLARSRAASRLQNGGVTTGGRRKEPGQRAVTSAWSPTICQST